MDSEFQPQPGETLGGYLKRLRMAAAQVQGTPITQDDVSKMTTHLPAPQRFTAAWLSVTEADGYKSAGGDKLRTLAALYSRLLRVTIPEEWLLRLAGHQVGQPVVSQPDQTVLADLLRHEDILALVAAAGQLVQMGYPEDVRLLVVLAQRYINAHDPKRRIGDIFDDPVLSAHVEKFMAEMGLA